jgi:hypothetical protein
MFTPDALASFVPAFVRAAEACVARWRESGARCSRSKTT